MPLKVRKLLAARIAPRCSGGLWSCMNAASGTSNKPELTPEQHQKRTGGEIAGGVMFAGGDQLAFDCIKQVGKQGQSTCPERQNAELDLAARPKAGQHAAEPHADDQRGQQRRDLCLLGGPALEGKLIDVELHQQAERPEEHDAQRDTEHGPVDRERSQVAERLPGDVARVPGKDAAG